MARRRADEREKKGKQGNRGGRDGGTTERPQPPKCDCTTGTEYVYTTIGSLKPVGRRRLRIRVAIKSVVVCDSGTPEHCYYEYKAEAEVQRERVRRVSGKIKRVWERYPKRKAFIQSFTVHDDVNKSEKPDRIDQPSVTLGEWFPKAPQKESTRITLELAGSVRGGWRTTINRNLVLCVPKLDNPQCP